MSIAQWKRGSNRLYSWNECSECGYKSMDTVFGEEIKPERCPECNSEMAGVIHPKPGRYKPSWYRQLEGCMAFFCVYGARVKERCVTCGFNVDEHCRRMNLPWVLDENGLLHKNIGMIKMEDRV